MHLTPHELDKLMLHQAGFVAQKRLARGLRLNYPESVALIATQILEFIRDGKSVASLMDIGRKMLGRADVLPGIPEMIHEVQVEGTFPDGTKLVTVHHPIASQRGNLKLALQGSFLPVPVRKPKRGAGRAANVVDVSDSVGAVATGQGEIELNQGRVAVDLMVKNSGDRPIQVGSHYHFSETNRALIFDRGLAYGKRLDIPAGTAVRFEPGESKKVSVVPIAGRRVVRGGNALASGPVDQGNPAEVAARAKQKGFGHLEAKK